MAKEQPSEALLASLNQGLYTEQAAYDTAYRQKGLSAAEKGAALVSLQAAQNSLLHKLQAVGATKDLDALLLAEKLILNNEKEFYADTPVMESSLSHALTEINAALTLVGKVREPGLYKSVTDDYYQTIKNRIGGLPKDEARQFFRSHHSRLTNHEKSRLSDDDKQLIRARKANLNQAKANYVELQKNVVLTPETVPEIEN